MDAKSMHDILHALMGQVVTVVNPQSYIPTLTGYKIDVETYKAKIVSYEDNTLKVLTEYMRDPHKKVKEKVYQFVPREQIKRVTVSQTERFITL